MGDRVRSFQEPRIEVDEIEIDCKHSREHADNESEYKEAKGAFMLCEWDMI